MQVAIWVYRHETRLGRIDGRGMDEALLRNGNGKGRCVVMVGWGVVGGSV